MAGASCPGTIPNVNSIRANRALLAAIAVLVAAACFASSASAAGGPSPFRRDLHRIDTRLRMAIEYAPVQLGEGLSTSETVCRLAEKTEEGGDAEAAGADWSTLSQLLDQLDRPALARVDGALLRADTGLRELRQMFSAGWSDHDKVAEMRRGVAGAREGIHLLRAAMDRIAESFDAWTTHQCQAATETINSGIARIPGAVGRVNAGMRILWELAGV